MSPTDNKTAGRRISNGRFPVGTPLAPEWRELPRESFNYAGDDPHAYCGPGLAMKRRKQSRSARSQRKIGSLRDHPEPYVTVTALAGYWLVSRKQIYKQIEAGTLKAIRLGPRLLRVSTDEALDFERRAKMTAKEEQSSSSSSVDYKKRSR